MERQIEKVAVLGAGVMGSTIAAHVAGVGIPCYLLDIVPKDLTDEEKAKGLTVDDPAVRNRFGTLGVRNALKSRPPAFYDEEDAALVTVGNFEDNMDWLDEADWIIEAVVENLDIKKRMFKSVEKFRSEGSIVSSNTSGLPITEMTKGLSKEMRRHFLGTHFFNPVRYMRLLEMVPIEDTDPQVFADIQAFDLDLMRRTVAQSPEIAPTGVKSPCHPHKVPVQCLEVPSEHREMVIAPAGLTGQRLDLEVGEVVAFRTDALCRIEVHAQSRVKEQAEAGASARHQLMCP